MPVRHALPHVDAGIDASGNSALDVPSRIVQQHFIAPDMHADRR